MKEWNKAPIVKEVFFDDFSQGIRSNVWRALNEHWKSQKNNGYSQDNCMYTTDSNQVSAHGATGGLVVICSNGDFAADVGQKRQGGGIVTKQLFGPGKYEVRMKVVPRVGQCSAIWTYFNNWADSIEALKYSEIDLETPYGGDYRHWTGTTYEKYFDTDNKICSSQAVDTIPLNDGQWHVMSFEWRTDEENGDCGVIWYFNGKKVLRINEAVPKYTATFWVASLFQDAIAWLGDPLFEKAYMYIDWVRITQYSDPCLDGNADKESQLCFTGIDLGNKPVPQTNYIANSDFSFPAQTTSFKGREIFSWKIHGGLIKDNQLSLKDGKAEQTIYAQYVNFQYKLKLTGKTNGKVLVYFQFLSGQANKIDPDFQVVGQSNVLQMDSSSNTLQGVLKIDHQQTEHIKLVIECVGECFIDDVHLTLC
jgi:beta-glucanase (GH16 family)